MNKQKLNKYFRKFGFEIHGIGYIEKLRNSSVDKDEWQKILQLTSGKANTIFDIGANRGSSAATYSRLFPKATIHSFEPLPDAAQIFREHHNGNANITLHNIALSSKKGTATFNVNKKSDTSSFLKSRKLGIATDDSCETVSQIEVQTNTVDLFCRENNIQHIDILKMDVQGFEAEVLKGSSEMLASGNVKIVFAEMFFEPQYENQALFFDISSILYKNGFVMQDMYDPYYSGTNLVWCDAIFINKKFY